MDNQERAAFERERAAFEREWAAFEREWAALSEEVLSGRADGRTGAPSIRTRRSA